MTPQDFTSADLTVIAEYVGQFKDPEQLIPLIDLSPELGKYGLPAGFRFEFDAVLDTLYFVEGAQVNVMRGKEQLGCMVLEKAMVQGHLVPVYAVKAKEIERAFEIIICGEEKIRGHWTFAAWQTALYKEVLARGTA